MPGDKFVRRRIVWPCLEVVASRNYSFWGLHSRSLSLLCFAWGLGREQFSLSLSLHFTSLLRGSLSLSLFLSAGHRGRLARPAGIQPTRPPPCASERTALGCLLTAAPTTKWDLCFRVASPTLNTRDPPHPGLITGPLWLPVVNVQIPGLAL